MLKFRIRDSWLIALAETTQKFNDEFERERAEQVMSESWVKGIVWSHKY